MSMPLFSIVLAGGSGRRLAPVTGGIPKQFWKFDGTRTLLDATLSRVGRLTGPDRTLIVVNRPHQEHVDALAVGRYGTILHQSADRGTGAGVLLPLIEILETAPDALVLLTPSDHGVVSAEQFQRAIAEARVAVDAGAHDVVLFGAEPREPSTDFGWITSIRRPSAPYGLARVVRFVEKPGQEEAERLFASGALWNTLVLVARADTLFELCAWHIGDVTAFFDRTRGMSSSTREQWLAAHYHELPATDFSHDVLSHARGLAVATFPRSMGWSDLGTPDRLTRWLVGRPAPAASVA
jgi:mannose-1-phosphate guanylyltransferase